jgi:dTDP-4-amino-4,6-dideoxygalactose transaminase
MKTIADYAKPFDAILEFEAAVAKYTGAPYCVTTDCCTHAMEIAFRLDDYDDYVTLPARTYLSVPMVLHKLKIPYLFRDVTWRGSYQFEGSNVWDCARQFEPNMYRPGSIQCISFGRTKPLQIGQGGCLLTDDEEIYRAASMMRSDGRDLFKFSPWITQKTFRVGYHYTMRPEECVFGLNLLNAEIFTRQIDEYFDYPDCRDLVIHD